jgi:hypothetical protein
MGEFFSTHRCNSLCAQLGLRAIPNDAHTTALATSSAGEANGGIMSSPSGQVLAASSHHTRLCLICDDSPREVRFLCGHATACVACAELIRRKDNLCPTCRSPLGAEPFRLIGNAATTTYVR